MLKVVRNRTEIAQLAKHRYVLYAKFNNGDAYAPIGIRPLIGYFQLRRKYGKSL